MRKLASIQIISDLQDIPGADNIQVATILGWKVVVRRGEFKVGDSCVYCELDSILPAKPEFEFLASKKYRVKTVKLRGQISQGIAFPLHAVCSGLLCASSFVVGDDVTNEMGITKYEVPEIQCNHTRIKMGKTAGNFPKYVPKTDETRIQSAPGLLSEIKDIPMYMSVKIDGTSASFINKDGKIDVCSRSVSRKDPLNKTTWEKIVDWYRWIMYKKKKEVPEDCVYWDIARKYNIIDILKHSGNIAIQGEIAGPNIQGNKLELEDHQLFVFNIFDIDKQEYYSFKEFSNFCLRNHLQPVPIIQIDTVFNDWTIDKFLELADGNYEFKSHGKGQVREGIVVRPMVEQYSKSLNGRMSFKVINQTFLLKEQ